jgi:hypothetical protein
MPRIARAVAEGFPHRKIPLDLRHSKKVVQKKYYKDKVVE